MQLNNAILITLLPALSAATGFLKKQDPLGASLAQDNAGNAAGHNECGLSSFEDYSDKFSSNDLPLVDDCKDVIIAATADAVKTLYSSTPTVLYSSGSCAFVAALVDGVPQGVYGYVGNSDVVDLVTDSINNFQHDKYVSSKGGYSMLVGTDGGVPCDSNVKGTQVGVNWWVQKPSF